MANITNTSTSLYNTTKSQQVIEKGEKK